MKILYFTATGNSLQVARYLEAEEMLSVPQLMRNETYTIDDDAIGIVTPCYCGGLPLIVQRFLAAARLRCNYLFAVITYGDMLASAPLRLEKLADGLNLDFNYINTIQMTDTYLPMYEISDQLTKLPAKKVPEYLEKMKSDIRSRTQYAPGTGIMSRLAGAMMQSGAKKIIGNTADERFHIDSHCTKCGTCARVCPVDNIELTPEPGFLHHCEGCLGCIHHCPAGALHIDKERSAVRYRNPEISLDEIIEANNQLASG